jgi:hypothetical protein
LRKFEWISPLTTAAFTGRIGEFKQKKCEAVGTEMGYRMKPGKVE